jgi:glyoxylase-like metal-dependent hydrolase (beta-lactamase superfamily II)
VQENFPGSAKGRTMQEIFAGVFMLEGEIGGRPLQIMYLQGNEASLLLDTGCGHDPAKFIVPQMREAGGDPGSLRWILNSHPDLDHVGGNHEMKQFAPQSILACGDADRASCQGLEGLMKHRYDVYRRDHQIFYDADTVAWMEAEGGKPQAIEATFRGGEHLRLGADWELEVLSVPGHSKGHLALYDIKHQALYGADAIHGRGYWSRGDEPKLCPTYLDVDDYLSTIQLIEHLPITTYVGCHWPVKEGSQVAAFCSESRQFVERVDRLLPDSLKHPLSLRELCLSLGPALGDWPRGVDIELVYALGGHVGRWVGLGRIRRQVRSVEPRVLEYVLA